MIIRRRVRGVIASETASGVGTNPSSSAARKGTGRAPARVTMGAYETQPGSGMIASSPESSRAMQVMNNVCFVGATRTSSGFAGIRFSFWDFSAIASRSSRMPEAGVYFVKPSSRALFAASMMCAGVGKSGSPIASERIFSPRAFRSVMRSLMRTVADGSIERTRFAKRAVMEAGKTGR